MQVRLSDGRQFRIGGDARIKLAESEVQLLSGSIIGWVQPGGLGGQPFRIKTRLATASIQGTTVFLELKDESLRVLSWEGKGFGDHQPRTEVHLGKRSTIAVERG
jgi:ferric-dicitrate binding protein FerR (iron transport regulator)